MFKFLNKKSIQILAVITFIIFIFAIFYKPPKPLPTVVESIPSSGSTKVNFFDQLYFKFDQDIDVSKLQITSIPEEDWQLSADKNVLALKSKQYLRVDTDYLLTISYLDKSIYNFKFKTLIQQSDPRYAQEVEVEMKKDYPMSALLPYENSEFYLVYLSPLTVQVKIKNPDLSAGEVLEEVKSWFTQNGGDVAAHKFIIATQ